MWTYRCHIRRHEQSCIACLLYLNEAVVNIATARPELVELLQEHYDKYPHHLSGRRLRGFLVYSAIEHSLVRSPLFESHNQFAHVCIN